MNFRIVMTCQAFALLATAACAAPAITEFDAPGCAFTYSSQINASGAITGSCTDGPGFVRAPDGTITSLAEDNSQPLTINARGDVAGYLPSTQEGFFTRRGRIEHFSVPGASGPFGTAPESMNDRGNLAGFYQDADRQTHAFVYNPKRGFDTFGANSRYTAAVSINASGTVTGISLDAHQTYHGFVRTLHGKITAFDADGAGRRHGRGTSPQCINAGGVVAGFYQDDANVKHGFVRDVAGVVTTVDIGRPQDGGTQVRSINDGGDTTGYFFGMDGRSHGFVRLADGTVTVFDPPDATQTYAISINASGAVAGYYSGADGSAVHGFVRTP